MAYRYKHPKLARYQLRYTSKIMLYYYIKAKTICQDFLSIEKTTKILFISIEKYL